MVQSNATLRLILALLVLCALGAGSGSVQASPSGHAPHGTVTIDGVTVPDVGPLPTVVPIPSSNLNYTAKIELGKQLYFDGRLSKNNAISCAFCHNPGTGFADPRQTSIGVGGGVGGRQSPTTGAIPCWARPTAQRRGVTAVTLSRPTTRRACGAAPAACPTSQ